MKQFSSTDLKKGFLKAYREDRFWVCYRKLSGKYIFQAFRNMADRDKVAKASRKAQVIINLNPSMF
jgi:hypothetical protein